MSRPEQIAVYWDFENMHASLCTLHYGPYWYRDKMNRHSRQPQLLDINSIMEFINSVGEVNINKAYGNWSFFFGYSFDLQNHAVDLVQMFPRGSHGKNGADIRMAIDAIEDITLNPHITTVVVIGGDSDYIALAQKVRQRGKKIVGIGVKETTNQYWMKSCNQFKYYSSLLVKSSSISNLEKEGYETGDLEDAKKLLVKAIKRITSETGEPRALKASIKPMLMRLDPSFDESNYGFSNFTSFLESCQDVVAIHVGEHDHTLSLQNGQNGDAPMPEPRVLHPYEVILQKQHVQLPDPAMLTAGIKETFALFVEHGEIAGYPRFREKLGERLGAIGIEAGVRDLNNIQQVLFRTFCFQLNRERHTLSLSPEVVSADMLWVRVVSYLVKRITDNIDDIPDYKAMSTLLFGNENNADQLKGIHDNELWKRPQG